MPSSFLYVWGPHLPRKLLQEKKRKEKCSSQRAEKSHCEEKGHHGMKTLGTQEPIQTNYVLMVSQKGTAHVHLHIPGCHVHIPD